MRIHGNQRMSTPCAFSQLTSKQVLLNVDYQVCVKTITNAIWDCTHLAQWPVLKEKKQTAALTGIWHVIFSAVSRDGMRFQKYHFRRSFDVPRGGVKSRRMSWALVSSWNFWRPLPQNHYGKHLLQNWHRSFPYMTSRYLTQLSYCGNRVLN